MSSVRNLHNPALSLFMNASPVALITTAFVLTLAACGRGENPSLTQVPLPPQAPVAATVTALAAPAPLTPTALAIPTPEPSTTPGAYLCDIQYATGEIDPSLIVPPDANLKPGHFISIVPDEDLGHLSEPHTDRLDFNPAFFENREGEFFLGIAGKEDPMGIWFFAPSGDKPFQLILRQKSSTFGAVELRATCPKTGSPAFFYLSTVELRRYTPQAKNAFIAIELDENGIPYFMVFQNIKE